MQLSECNLFINIHSHKLTCAENELALLNIFAQDFAAYSQTANYIYSVGLHPWHISRENVREAINAVSVAAGEDQVIAIGETGLDRVIETPIEVQSDLFISHLKIAEQVKKPLMIHCVRASSDIIAIRKKYRFTTPWIIHGFNSNAQTARQLIDHGCYLSFGKFLMNPKSRIPEIFPGIPDKHIFLENDDSNLTIEEVYQKACELKGLSMEVMKSIICENFNRCFNSNRI